MLGAVRYDDYQSWVNVGMCLHNINPNYLVIWDEWSQKSPKYNDIECDKKWKTFKKSDNGLNIGSLLMWAKNDTPEEYENIMKIKCFTFISSW